MGSCGVHGVRRYLGLVSLRTLSKRRGSRNFFQAARRSSEATAGTLRSIRSAICWRVQPWQCFRTTTSRIGSGRSARASTSRSSSSFRSARPLGDVWSAASQAAKPEAERSRSASSERSRTDVPLVAIVVLDRVGQRAGQDLRSQAARTSGSGLALGQGRIGAEHRLLDDVGRVELAAQPAVEMQLRQHRQVLAERLQELLGVLGYHGLPYP